MRKRERFESAWWEVRDDEDEPGEPFWYGAGSGDKEASEFDPGEPLIMDPRHFPVGTRVEISEPDDPEFYDRLFAEREKAIASASAPTPPADDVAALTAERDEARALLTQCWDAAGLLCAHMTGKPGQAWEEGEDLANQIEDLAGRAGEENDRDELESQVDALRASNARLRAAAEKVCSAATQMIQVGAKYSTMETAALDQLRAALAEGRGE